MKKQKKLKLVRGSNKTPADHANKFIAESKALKCLIIAWYPDGNIATTKHKLNQVELYGLAKVIEQQAADVGAASV